MSLANVCIGSSAAAIVGMRRIQIFPHQQDNFVRDSIPSADERNCDGLRESGIFLAAPVSLTETLPILGQSLRQHRPNALRTERLGPIVDVPQRCKLSTDLAQAPALTRLRVYSA